MAALISMEELELPQKIEDRLAILILKIGDRKGVYRNLYNRYAAGTCSSMSPEEGGCYTASMMK